MVMSVTLEVFQLERSPREVREEERSDDYGDDRSDDYSDDRDTFLVAFPVSLFVVFQLHCVCFLSFL